MDVSEWLGKDNTLGIDIWNKKYRHNNESFDEWLDRVSDFTDGSPRFASLDGGVDKEFLSKEIRRLILQKKFLFGGRILANRGLNKEGVKATYSNCFSGNTEIRTRQGIVEMKDVVDEDIEVFSFGAWRPATVRYFGEQRMFTLNVKKLNSTASYSVTPNHIWYAKKKSDSTFQEYTTEELEPGMILREDYTKAYRSYKPSPFGVAHGLFYGDGDHTGVYRRMNLCGDKAELLPYFTPDTVGSSGDTITICSIPKIFWGKPSLDETPSYLYGWLSGYFAADGSIDTHGNCVICSSKKSDLEFVQDVLCVLGMPIYEIREQVRESNLTHEVSTIYILSLSRKYFNENFFVRSKHKERFLANGNKSRDNPWVVDSIEVSSSVEPVYCVVEEERHSFTLKNGILTHNCYCLAVKDSIQDIYEVAKNTALTYKAGGGVGIDISNLAPAGAKVNNPAKTSSGAVSFIELFTTTTGLIGINGRRSALMVSMACDHPDIGEFIDLKTDVDKATTANLSVRVSDEFMNVARDDRINDWNCKFYRMETDELISRHYDAKKLFRKLCDANYDYGEPGILFWDKIKSYSIVSDYPNFKFAGVNPCGETALPDGGACLLGSMNLSAYVVDGKFDMNAFGRDVSTAIRALNLVQMEGEDHHPLEKQKETARNWRQIGLGIMGLGDMLIKMNMVYGSYESITLCDEIADTMAKSAIHESVVLGHKIGSFGMFNEDDTNKSEFIRNHTDKRITALRNAQLLSIAPTGSISTMLGVSGGIEPLYALEYTRTTKSLQGREETYSVCPEVVQNARKEGRTGCLVCAKDIPYANRIRMQAVWQKHVDASISSTINLPEDFNREEIWDIYFSAWEAGLKGITVFRDGCKRAGILNTKKEEPTQVIDVKSEELVGKKRKLMTGCGSLHVTAFFDKNTGDLRETFLSHGSTGGCNNFMIGLSRMVSLSARAGCSIDAIVDQLKSCGSCPSYAVRRATKGDTSLGSCCPSAVGNALIEMHEEMLRELDKGVAPQTPPKEDKPIVNPCPVCGAELHFTNGCMSCTCGFSKCG